MVKIFLENGVPDAIRTHDLLFRRQTLYPAELRGHLWLNIAGGSICQVLTCKYPRIIFQKKREDKENID